NPLAHSEIVRAKSYFDGTTISGTNPESPAGFLCWNKWDSTFLGSCEPSFIDTALLPDLRVRIYLAPDAVLSSSTTTAMSSFVTAPTTPAASYTLSEISANIECVSMPSGLYDDMVNALMDKTGFLELPFKSIHTFNGLHTGSTRFSVSSQSLDRVWLAWRASSYSTLGAPVKVAGYKGTGAFVSTTAGQATNVDVGIPGYDAGGTRYGGSERYIGKFFKFEEPGSGMKFQLQLNGSYYPQYLANSDEWLEISRNSIDSSSSHFRDMSPHQYKSDYYVQCVRLNFPHSEKLRMLSGLDCRGVNLDGVVQSEGAGSSQNLTIWTESSSSLRIARGREIQVIH
ncbi:Major Capsid Protein, partial [Pleurochrysis sp. Polinton-like virus]